uniref:Genome sequencing data, contig C305 n=1 Tax=Microcystis aeruginosa (strain PCC 7806) TaxID=267872 RepID=A8YFK8_MICA7|nr:unnamed protein product [Microcystis aeruginosa PCC 7806]
MKPQRIRQRECYPSRNGWQNPPVFLLRVVKQSDTPIRNWFGEIISYFERRTTNGMVEGINNKIKLIKRRGYGFRNFRNFWVRSMLSWHLVC